MKIRARAVVIKDGKILLIKRTKPGTAYWVIPGGAVEDGESDKQALVRECKEELGADVAVNGLILKMDSLKPATKGWQEHFFLCKITGGEAGTGRGPEFQKNRSYVGRYDIEWVSINHLSAIDLKPEEIKRIVISKFNQVK